MAWPCVWVEETGDVDLQLRRYRMRWRDDDGTPEPGDHFHSATTSGIGRRPARMTDDDAFELWPAEEFAGDDRWPTACACGYVFVDDDHWYVNQNPIYRAIDGREWIDWQLPIGALYSSPWYIQFGAGPDGLALMCVLPRPAAGGDWEPDHAWHVDGPSTSTPNKPNTWTRTGDPRADPPTVDVNPSILTGTYHGYIRHGVLTDSL